MQHFRITAALLFLAFACLESLAGEKNSRIDRRALVTRNNVLAESFDSLASLSVGNGEFAFTTDITGLQTFYREYENGVTLGTQSNWGWHTFPNPSSYRLEECNQFYEYRGRKVPYLVQPGGERRETAASNYFRENPQRLQLGVIRLKILKKDGSEIRLADVGNPKHCLDMWQGRITSEFSVEGMPVKVEVFCHQETDLVSARITSPMVAQGRLSVEWLFPYAVPQNTHSGYDFNSPDKHTSVLHQDGSQSADITRTLDQDRYHVRIQWSPGGKFTESGKHHFQLTPGKGAVLEFSCLFSPAEPQKKLPSFSDTESENMASWKEFWMKSGVVDFSACTDPRAAELERRFVLSQYLTKIQSSGSLPPQETGLVFNSWYGKFHLEMHWWHSAHFANWNHPEYLVKQLDWYRTILAKAKETAGLQGFKGVRWPKMVGPEGQNSPSGVGSFLVWQQPHFIYMAEQLYLSRPSEEILRKYSDLVFATADFMADFAVPGADGHYNLMPPMIPAQEHWNRETATNPPFELSYWHWALGVANAWKQRLHLPADPAWERVEKNLAAPVVFDGTYPGVANAPDSYTNPKAVTDHPSVLGALGVLPAWDKIDPAVMRKTLLTIMQKWNWPTTWGWDYPMVAMTAARLNEPDLAIQALLMNVQKNTYLRNGHNFQSSRLRIYLPGNGGLLKAISMMCAGWEGSTLENPGFPKDGKWNVKWEGLVKDF